MCNKHRLRMLRHGSPLALVRDANIAFLRRAAWMDTDDCVVPPWYDGTRPVVKVGGVRRSAARQAWIFRHGDPGERSVLHTCSGGSGDLGCVNVRHLRLGDDAENTRDREVAGRTVLPMVRGEEHGNAKLTVLDVREIRRLAAAGVSRAEIAGQFPVSRGTVSKIVNRERWAWLDEEVATG
ncbi:hypothetical protein [Streptomyces salinarius]|uniref:hypothetical protein n=1 Tax=Streptomyces salinarius TaxID=2762598 RepID=UPI0028524A17|nr:hypothetical protein [Streptomyces salinarius]